MSQDDTSVSAVVQIAPKRASRYQLIPAGELSKLPPCELLADTHLVSRGFNITFGPSGVYKSFFCLDMALRISQAVPVVYVAAEGASGLFQRVWAWADHYQLPTKNMLFLCQEVNLRESGSVKDFIQTVRDSGMQPGLVVIDTLARCLVGGDENSSKDVGVAIYHSDLIRRAFDTAVLWIHHSNKAETGERGSGAMRGAADSMMEMSVDENDLIKVKCSKIKDSESWGTEVYKFNRIGQSGVLLAIDDMEMEALQLSSAQVEVLKFLNQKSLKDCGAKVLHIREALKQSLATTYRVLTTLEEKNLVFHEKRGDPYFISHAGEQAISKARVREARVLSFVKKEDAVGE